MERIVELLEKKNDYLEKFFVISDAELLNFKAGDFDNLESFYDCREKILNIIKHIEKEVEKISHQFSPSEKMPPEMLAQMKVEMSSKDVWVSKILDLDLEIMSCIEAEKSSMIRELSSVKAGKKVLEGYHSGAKPAYQLDEKI